MARFSLQQAGILTISLGMAACASFPGISRTQVVRDLKVEMQLLPHERSVSPGDAVRWVNLRKEWVLVQIPDVDSDPLAGTDVGTCEDLAQRDSLALLHGVPRSTTAEPLRELDDRNRERGAERQHEPGRNRRDLESEQIAERRERERQELEQQHRGGRCEQVWISS